MRLQRFARDQKGSLSVEVVFAIPILALLLVTLMVFWDAFRTMNVSQKTAYMVADLMSRESEMNETFIEGAFEVYDYLAASKGDNALRVSVARYLEDPYTGDVSKELILSHGVGGSTGHDDVTPIADRMPLMANGEYIIIVEAEQVWMPKFSVGLSSYRFYSFAAARPRFAPQLIWTGT